MTGPNPAQWPPGPNPAPQRPPFQLHWLAFGLTLGTLLTVGGIAAFMSLWAVAMITDSCGPASAGDVCNVSPRGNTALLFVPWLAVGALGAGSLAVAVVAVRRRWSPLFGLPAGLAAAYLVFKVGIWVCLQL